MKDDNKKKVEVKKEAKKLPGFYKGYEIKWLREQPEHPDFYLVKEFDEKKDKGGEK